MLLKNSWIRNLYHDILFTINSQNDPKTLDSNYSVSYFVLAPVKRADDVKFT